VEGDRPARIGSPERSEDDVDDRARIVVGVDGSECARAALEFALTEAARRDAELHVVSVVPTLEYWPVGFGMASYQREK
jgi:nucleotide-binding universal stress UspA family protein